MTGAPKEIKYQVTVGELLKLARAVSESSVKAPAPVLNVAKRAVSLKKDVTSFFIGRGGGGNAFNKRHAYFIQVMEEICDLLSWEEVGAPDPSKSTIAVNADKTSESDDWMNRFAALSSDEKDDIEETEMADVVTESAASIEVIRVEAVEKDEEDYLSLGFFRLLCLLHDLQKWRMFLSDTWTEHANLEIDLATALVVTDTALQLAKDLCQDRLAQLPAMFPKDSYMLQQVVFEMAVSVSGRPYVPSKHLGLPFDVRMGDAVDWAFLTTGILLDSFIDVIEDGVVPLYKPSRLTCVPYEVKKETNDTANRILLELLPEYSMLSSYKAPLPVQDEITIGLINYIKNSESSLLLAFATQVMLDSVHATRHSRLGPAADLRMLGLRTAKTIDEYLDLSKTHPKPEFWSEEGD